MAQKEKLGPSRNKKSATDGTFQLIVVFQGTFVFALQIGDPPNQDLITGINVYAPACGHMYSAGIAGGWNNPHKPQGANDKSGGLLMLDCRRHCLEITANSQSDLSLSTLRNDLQKTNLWPAVGRPIMQGWDLVMRIPPPTDNASWETDSISVKGCFKGSDHSTFTQMGMIHALTYSNVTSFKLKGSPLPIHPPNGESQTVVFHVNAEPACISSMDHQRRAAEALAQVIGLDLTLEKPLPAMDGSKMSRGPFQVTNAKTGSCMGSAIVEPG